jgi:hypothetical protein
MPVIIRVIAPTFSERNRASRGGAEPNAADQIEVMYSARDGASVGFAAKAVAVAIRPAITTHELRRNRERVKRSILALADAPGRLIQPARLRST